MLFELVKNIRKNGFWLKIKTNETEEMNSENINFSVVEIIF
jgi:hypothetical protein